MSKNLMYQLKELNAVPWYITTKGLIKVPMMAFMNCLVFLGIRLANIDGHTVLVLIKNNIVRIMDKSDVVQLMLEWLDNNFDDEVQTGIFKIDIKEAWISKSRQLFEQTTLNYLTKVTIEQHFDTKDKMYFYFRNIVVRVCKNVIDFIEYKNLDGYVLKEQIIDREFTMPKSKRMELLPLLGHKI